MARNQSTSSPQSEPAALSTDKGATGLGEIVVFVDGRNETAGILEFAGVLAQEHGARGDLDRAARARMFSSDPSPGLCLTATDIHSA